MTAETASRLFTVEEANELIQVIHPKVVRVKEAIVRARAQIRTIGGTGGAGSRRDGVHRAELGESAVSGLVQEARSLIAEIHTYGCLVNGPEAGLVDFPCLLGSELVFLCWKLGEPTVGHWHRIADGFAGRRPLLDARADKGWVH